MANLIPLAIADVELQLATAISVGTTSFTLSSANDDDGNALPAGKYCFTLDSGTSNKEYLMGQVNGTAVTSVKSVSRQGVESTGAARAHRVGAPCIVTNFATLQRVADILRGQLDLDGASPVGYDAEPTLADRKDLATVGYVLDTVSGGTVAFDAQTITGNGGEAIVAGNLVYFKTSDQEWYLTDADTAATVEGVQLGIALGTGSDGVAISGGIQISGTYTTSGLTAGALYYAGNTAGAISSSAGTTSQIIGLALSTTKLLLIPRNPRYPTTKQEDALAGGGDFGTPSSSNKYMTEEKFFGSGTQVVTFLASGTWTKDANLKRIRVELWGGGGSGGRTNSTTDESGGGGGGSYTEKWFEAASLGATETVTIGAGGAAASSTGPGNAGAVSTFGSLITAYAGGAGHGGSSSNAGGGGGGSLFTSGGTSISNVGGSAGSPSEPIAGAGGTDNSIIPSNVLYGAGGGGASSAGGTAGGKSYYAGGGGGGAASGGAGAGGTSTFGGAGGAGNNAFSGNATSGSQPGGGGGGKWSSSGTGNSGAGGDGKCIVTEYYS